MGRYQSFLGPNCTSSCSMGDQDRKTADTSSTSSYDGLGHYHTEKSGSDSGDKDFSAGLSFVAISQVKTLKGLAFHTHFDHAWLKKRKETDTMLMLKKDTEHHNQLGF